MSQPELRVVDASALPNTTLPFAEGIIQQALVKLKSRHVEVWLKSSDPSRFQEASEEDLRTFFADFWKNYSDVEQACALHLPRDCKVSVRPMLWDLSPMPEMVHSLVAVLVEMYGEEEAIAAKWLGMAECRVEGPGEGELTMSVDRPSQFYNVSFLLRSDSERAALQKKRSADWFREAAKRVFGVDLLVSFDIDALASDKAEALRKTLAEAERVEIVEIVSREAEAPKQERPSQERSGSDRPYYRRDRKSDDEPVRPLTLGRSIDGPLTPIREIVDEMRRVAVEGRVFQVETRQLPSGRTLAQFNITDESDSISAKLFVNGEKQAQALEPLSDGVHLRLQGQVQFDTYAKEIVLMVQDMQPVSAPVRVDTAEVKRVELHLHTNMSSLDGVTPVDVLVKQAAAWGHSAIAITDHGGVQSLPEAYSIGKKNGVKILFGVEAYVVDDGTPIVYRAVPRVLNEETEYVVFDTETTGLNAREDTLIEIAAVRMRGNRILDSFSTLVNPERHLSQKISELTGITPDMLVGQPLLTQALPRFREFVQDAILVAHNAEFDVGFLRQCADRIGMEPWTQPVVDTLALARTLYPGEKNYRLKTLTQKFSVELNNHHRALADTEATAKVFAHMLEDVQKQNVHALDELNHLSGEIDVSKIRPFHATILVRNQIGLRNLYELVSLAHTKYLFRVPRLPRSELIRLREGLLIGTACQQGELFQAFIRGRSSEEIEEICEFYDYLEIQPPSHYEHLMRDELIQSFESVRQIHRQIVDIGQKLNKPVVATGDVHYLNPQDAVYREIFLQNQNAAEAAKQPPLHFRTTDEMLAEFSYLGDNAYKVVVEAPLSVADAIESIPPMPHELFAPIIDGAEDEVRRLTYDKAHRLYGDELPPTIEARLQKELHSIISHGFAVIYLTAHKLVTKSLSDGYLVGSRGSVGSSLVATMMDITEVNPMPPHYLCPGCRRSEFVEDGSVGSGFDLPDKVCPNCGTQFLREGQDIPFETFLGFDGDKVPDIDLNFSGEYQAKAHKYTEELFGSDHVFRAGTIASVAEKTAYGYVRKFAEERGLVLRNAEIDRLVKGCTGVRRTSGQHPGGQIVVPRDRSIYEFTPVQYPADNKNSGTFTTHFDYHSGLEECLLKLDILGHESPTMIRMLEDLTGVDARRIPLNDETVLALFRGTEPLGVPPEQLRCKTATYGIPEFGTRFVQQMLEDTRPTTFSELVRISGLSHGTDVWVNNAQDLVRNQVATLSEVICARDDIMVYLMYKGLEPGRSFRIMEAIRKGRGVKDEDAEYMREHGVPEWYIESGRKIKYMFPKAHAAAYVIMSVRIAWFKIYHPLAFYATYFSSNVDDFDVTVICGGQSAILKRMEEIEQKGNAASAKEKGSLTVLEVALEMVLRGYRFLPVDLYQSQASRFTVVPEENGLLPPFAAIQGVGGAAATSLAQARDGGPFLSIEDLQNRSRISKTVVEILEGLGCLKGLPENNQLSLFSF